MSQNATAVLFYLNVSNPSMSCKKGAPTTVKDGTKDRTVPVSETRDVIAAIRQAGGNPRYTEFPDATHDIWRRSRKQRNYQNGYLAQKRG